MPHEMGSRVFITVSQKIVKGTRIVALITMLLIYCYVKNSDLAMKDLLTNFMEIFITCVFLF